MIKVGGWNNMKNQFSNNLKYYRRLHNMTQSDLAHKLNVTRQTISNYETYARTCDLDMLIQIADIFKISLDDLIR